MDSIYSYLDNIDVTVSSDINIVDKWIDENIINKKCQHLGFDTESKILFNNSQSSHKLAIIQISTPTNVLICRVFDMSIINWSKLLIDILENEVIYKYCVDSRQDNELLVKLGINLKGLVDVQAIANNEVRLGMKTLANDLLGLKINKSKSIQAGDWSRYPLSIKQTEYASTDAIVSLALAEHLNLAPKQLIRTLPLNTKTPITGDKNECIINLLIHYIKYTKKELNLADKNGYISLHDIIKLVDFKRLYTSIDEIESVIINDKKSRLYLLDDSYNLSKNIDKSKLVS